MAGFVSPLTMTATFTLWLMNHTSCSWTASSELTSHVRRRKSNATFGLVYTGQEDTVNAAQSDRRQTDGKSHAGMQLHADYELTLRPRWRPGNWRKIRDSIKKSQKCSRMICILPYRIRIDRSSRLGTFGPTREGRFQTARETSGKRCG